MDERLAQLISDYQRAVGTAVFLMSESGIEIPLNINDPLNLNIPAQGELNGGIRYVKHGYGCWVHLPEGEVDFDFGQRGEIDGFDEWRLWKFCQHRPNTYAFDTQQALLDCVGHAFKEGKLAASSHNLYYVVDSVRSLGEKAARILVVGCALPHWTRDSVLTLSSQCFDSANLMFEHYEAVKRLLTKEQKLSSANILKFRVYLLSWLGYLHTTAKGFKDLGMRRLLQNKRPESFLDLIAKCNEVGKLEARHTDDLRVLRNNIFHLRTNDEAIRQFFSDDGKRMEWARGLHTAFASFFSDYRVLAEVHYLCSGRFGESQIRGKSTKRRKKKGREGYGETAGNEGRVSAPTSSR
ncbi:MAG: hypothetical protein IV101_03705 [Dechloromonas sp.]|uniref:DUF6896 domain-containing protein n=1 Tax=Dechloromonas sp. TaxID=1917218 RepID=UPI0027FD7BF8|nr:hypothetical protein [Dechloromonas sp.]MBT9519978.1 hypothetical protein [Dechloromonas sp.]